MRKLLVLSVLAVLAAGATGCTSRNPCSPSWRPGYYLFGAGRQPQAAAAECCDPCMSAPTMMSAPCCQ